MDIDTLQQGLADIQGAPEAGVTGVTEVAGAQAPWVLNKDSLMQDYGSWFGNNEALGEVILRQLNANGVDTKAATEAMLRTVLQNLVEDNNKLQQSLQNFTAMLAQQTQQTQATANAITQAINMTDPTAAATAIPPLDAGQMPVEQPQEQMPVEQPQEQMPVEQPQEQTPAEQPQEQTPAEQPQGTVSDERVKEKCYTVSDASLKNIAACFRNSRGKKLNPTFINACNRSM